MPLLHCKECHHEWESTQKEEKCSWCGASSYLLQKETELEKLCKQLKRKQKSNDNKEV